MGFVKKLGEFTKKLSKPVADSLAIRNRSKNIIGFYGTMDNSGTTSLLMNVAEYLQEPGSPVVVVDFNLDCPVCYRYINVDEIPESKSLINKFKTISLSSSEIVVGDTNTLCTVSTTGYEHPSDYCDINITVIESLLKELSMHYKYVLVDLGTSLNNEVTIGGILTCNKVYSVVRPISSQLSKLMAVKEIIENLGHKNKIYDVIQTMILDNDYSQKDFQEVGLNLIGNIRQDAELMIFADNCKLVGGGLKSKEASRYVKFIKQLGDDIKNIVANSYIASENDIIVGNKDDIDFSSKESLEGDDELL